MIETLLKLGAVSGTVKDLEQTETGKFALGTAKAAVIISLSIAGLVAFFVLRSVNKTFGSTKKDVEIIKSQMIGMQQKVEDKDKNYGN